MLSAVWQLTFRATQTEKLENVAIWSRDKMLDDFVATLLTDLYDVHGELSWDLTL